MSDFIRPTVASVVAHPFSFIRWAAVAGLVAVLWLALPFTAHAKIFYLEPSAPPYAPGDDTIGVFFTDTGAPRIVRFTLTGAEDQDQKRKLMLDALVAAGIDAQVIPGGVIKIAKVHFVSWNAGTGERHDVLAAEGLAQGEFGLQPGIPGVAPSGVAFGGGPAQFAVAFGGPGFFADAQVSASAFLPGFSIDDVLQGLHQQLVVDLASPLQQALYLDLNRDVIGFDPRGLFAPGGSERWFIQGGLNDQSLHAVLALAVLPEPATGLLVGAALVGLGALRRR